VTKFRVENENGLDAKRKRKDSIKSVDLLRARNNSHLEYAKNVNRSWFKYPPQ
jgi:hypothetical protein